MRTRVLVCDHEPISARALSRVLRDAGFDVDAASTAAEALDRAALRVPDAVIVERTLPDGDGVDVCRCLRDWSAMPLIVVSATDEEDEKVRALDASHDYVVKPFAPRDSSRACLHSCDAHSATTPSRDLRSAASGSISRPGC